MFERIQNNQFQQLITRLYSGERIAIKESITEVYHLLHLVTRDGATVDLCTGREIPPPPPSLRFIEENGQVASVSVVVDRTLDSIDMQAFF